MWNGYCGDLIRRTNRNQLLALVCIAALSGSILYARGYYLSQFFRGPSAVDAAFVVQHPKEDQFVQTRVERAFHTGVRHTTTNNGVTKVDSEYFVTPAAGKLLILRVPDGGHPEELNSFPFEGRVRLLPGDVSAALEKRRNPDAPPLAPYYIDGEDYRGVATGLLIMGVPLLLFWLWLLRRYWPGAADFNRHFFARRVARYGPLETLVPEIDAEVAAADAARSVPFVKVKITRNWLAVGKPFDADAVRLSHLVWAHPYQVKRKLYYLITVAKYDYLKVYDDLGKEVQVRLTRKGMEAVMQDLMVKCPQAIFGYHAAIEKIWKRLRTKQPGAFLQEVRALTGQTGLTNPGTSA